MKNKSKNQTEKNNFKTSFSVAEECYADGSPELLKHIKQRETQGFDDTETWLLDKTLALFLLPRLKRYIIVNNGFPGGETEISFNEKLNFIVNAFQDYYNDDTDKQSLEIEKERLHNAKKAVNILSELWFDLWW
jgi:hypothetical protein